MSKISCVYFDTIMTLLQDSFIVFLCIKLLLFSFESIYLLDLWLNIPVNSYGHVRQPVKLTILFSQASWFLNQQGKNDPRKYFMINLCMDSLVGSQSPSIHSISHKHQLYGFSPVCIFSCLCRYQDFRQLSRQAVIRMVSSRTYPLYEQLGGFSKCPFYHSISNTHHIYMVSLLYVFSHATVATKISESSH